MVVDHAVLDGLVDQVRVAVGRQDDHGRARVAGNLPRGREPIEPRHLDVHQDDIRQRAAADLDGAMAVVDHRHHVVPQGLELALQAGGHGLLVVGDQNLAAVHTLCLLAGPGVDGADRAQMSRRPRFGTSTLIGWPLYCPPAGWRRQADGRARLDAGDHNKHNPYPNPPIP
jgi:hypothetical protein